MRTRRAYEPVGMYQHQTVHYNRYRPNLSALERSGRGKTVGVGGIRTGRAKLLSDSAAPKEQFGSA